jgi:excisionase family DNA binding protein
MQVNRPETAGTSRILPATLSIEEAGRLLGYSRDTAYAAARTDALPTILLGKRKRRVPTHRLLELLDARHLGDREE